MTSPTALIVDDEDNLRAYLRTQLARRWPELVVVAEAANGESALAAWRELQPDFVFLDVQMPGISGMEVAERIAGSVHIVFVTAYDQYAIEAFDQAAVDYLLKPVSDERLMKTIARLKDKKKGDARTAASADLKQLLNALRHPGESNTYLHWIKASRQGQINLIAIDDIDYFKSADKYTTVVTRQGEWLIRTSLKKLETELDPDKFWRIHRGTIVRVEAIEAFKRGFSGKAMVKLYNHEQPLPVSRAHEAVFRAD